MNIIRSVVSGKRNRYKDGEYDLDLSYITPRVIAMAYPGAGMESFYRNPIADVSKFLKSRHGEAYFVFNLSERPYSPTHFGNRVLEMGFPDHFAPPMTLCWTICKTIDAWIQAEPQNVAVIHCLAGKGRTGVVIAGYLLFSGHVFKTQLARARHSITGGPATSSTPTPKQLRNRANTDSTPHRASLVSTDASEAFNPFNTSAPVGLKLGRSLSSSQAEAVEAAGGADSRPSSPKTATSASDSETTPSYTGSEVLILPPPADMAREALTMFKTRRGEGVKYPSQERTVRYFARIVHAIIIAENTIMEEADKIGATAAESEADVPAVAAEGSAKDGALFPTRAALEAQLSHILKSPEIKTPVCVRLQAAERIRSLRHLPLPAETPILVSRILIYGIPDIPGGFIPRLQITTAPYQGAQTRVIYNSVWHQPVPTVYKVEDGVVLFTMHALMAGDVLIQVRQLPSDVELFRFSFQTTLMAHEDVHGVFRLYLKDLDMEKRKSRETHFPAGFFVDVIYELASQEEWKAAATQARPADKRDSKTEAAKALSVSAGSMPFGDEDAYSDDDDEDEDSGDSEDTSAHGSRPLPDYSTRSPSLAASTAHKPPTGRASLPGPLRQAGDAEAVPDVVCMGYLTKRGAMFKSWKRRWFVLKRSGSAGTDTSGAAAVGMLMYYENSKDTVAKGVIPLTRAAISSLQILSASDVTDTTAAGRENCFLMKREGRVHYFQADTDRDLSRWMNAIRGMATVTSPLVQPAAPPPSS